MSCRRSICKFQCQLCVLPKKSFMAGLGPRMSFPWLIPRHWSGLRRTPVIGAIAIVTEELSKLVAKPRVALFELFGESWDSKKMENTRYMEPESNGQWSDVNPANACHVMAR